MENAADALKMAASVLIFVVALSISINAFGEARIASRTILDYKDREYDSTYIEDNRTTERIVGLESIVPSIYKAYKENYKIVFKDSDTSEGANSLLGDEGIYRRKDDQGNYAGIYSIDLQKEVLGNDTQKEQFIMAILYGDRYDDFDTVREKFVENLGIYLNEEGIYDKIKAKGTGLKESLGIYYQEETASSSSDTTDDESTNSVPDSNKTIKRVITYSIPN